MKRFVIFILTFGILASAVPVFAESPEEAKKRQYQEIKAIKDKQRLEREARKSGKTASGVPAEESKAAKFWKKEGERSGLGNPGERMGNVFKNLNPVPFFKDQKERYNARKAQAGTVAK